MSLKLIEHTLQVWPGRRVYKIGVDDAISTMQSPETGAFSSYGGSRRASRQTLTAPSYLCPNNGMHACVWIRNREINGSKNWRPCSIDRTIAFSSNKDRQHSMQTIRYGTTRYALHNATAVRLLRRAADRRMSVSDGLNRALVALALKVEEGSLSAAEATELERSVDRLS